MGRFTIAGAVLLVIAVAMPAVGQTAYVYEFSSSKLLRIDPTGPTITSFNRPYFGRGHCLAHDGGVYLGVWMPGGPARLAHIDTAKNMVTTVARGINATHFGAPYVPCLDAEAQDGPGIWVLDGTTTAPSTLHGISKPKSCRIDVNKSTINWDNIVPLPWVPMSDAYPDPHASNQMLAVGFWYYNPISIVVHSVYGVATTAQPAVLTTLNHPCAYDAFLHEDRRVYCWTNFTPTQQIRFFPKFVGLHSVDTKTASKQSIPLSLPFSNHAPWAAAWNEPWEQPGRIAYIACDADDRLYKVDLLATPPAAISVTNLPPGSYIHGREIEEAQLASWRKGKTGRVFHLNFGKATAGKSYLLAPSLSGYLNSPIRMQPGGLELWMAPDLITAAAVQGHLGYAAWGTLDSSGIKVVTFDLGARLGQDAHWATLVIDKGRVLDISNVICVSM